MATFSELRNQVQVMGKEQATSRIQELMKLELTSYFELGALFDLHQTQEVPWHGGKNQFRRWVEMDLKTEWTKARRMMLAYRRGLALELKDQDLDGVCLSKASLLLRQPSKTITKGTVQGWLEKARGMTFAELVDELRKARGMKAKPKTLAEFKKSKTKAMVVTYAVIRDQDVESLRAVRTALEERTGVKYLMTHEEGRGEFFGDLARKFLELTAEQQAEGDAPELVAELRIPRVDLGSNVLEFESMTAE